MKTRILLACLALVSLPVAAASLNGKVGFVTKRGQKPVLTETVVWLEPAQGSKLAPPKPANQVMRTWSKTLSPHIMTVPVGSTVEFPNEDFIKHNLFSPELFDLGLYGRGAKKSYTFTKPGIVNIYCNVHPTMSAVVHVVNTPFVTSPDATGTFKFADVPAGKYRLSAWNELAGSTAADVTVDAAGAISGSTALTIDGRTLRVTPHLNKEGKPYKSQSGDY